MENTKKITGVIVCLLLLVTIVGFYLYLNVNTCPSDNTSSEFPPNSSPQIGSETQNENQIVSPFGICQVYSNWTELAPHRDSALSANVKWIREDFVWQQIEPTKGSFDFSVYDNIVDDALANGFNILGICAPGGAEEYANPWSSGSASPNTDEHYQDYADFVAALVQRYKGKVTHWEIWNEPDGEEYWKPQPNVIDYVSLLKRAYTTAKEVDPSVKIVGMGGVDSGNTNYISTAFQNGALDYMDIISVHPYGDSAIFEASTQYQNLDVIENLISTYGASTPIWATEVGYFTYDEGVDEDRQAELLVRVYLSLLSKGVKNVFWYNLADDPNYAPVGDNSVPHPGLFDGNLSPRKTYYSYKTMATLLEGHEFSKEYNLGETCKAVLFENSTAENVLVLWTYGEQIDERGNVTSAQEKNISLTVTRMVDNILDIYGQPAQQLSLENSTLTVKINNSPIYVIGEFSIAE